jgi:hypothetical protein
MKSHQQIKRRNSHQPNFVRIAASIAAMLLLVVSPAFAGPPLLCHAIDIGSAHSLPWTSTGWNLTGTENYDSSRVVADTLALLTPDTPVLVRMETLRRATLYAQHRAASAKELLLKLEARTRENPKDALAAFDLGYAAETYKQLRELTWMKGAASLDPELVRSNPAMNLDGYAMVKKAIALRGQDAQMEFAAALIASEAAKGEQQEHVQKARDGAKGDTLLTRNLEQRFPERIAKASQ